MKPFLSRSRRGAALVEYGLLVGLIATGAIFAVTNVGQQLSNSFEISNGKIDFALNAIAPTVSSFTQAPNGRTVDIVYAGGDVYEDCAIEIEGSFGWVAVQQADCETGNVSLSIFDGILGNDWDGAGVRLISYAANEVLTDFGTLSCASMTLSEAQTPDVDENCNGIFDDAASRDTVYENPRYSSSNYMIRNGDFAFCQFRGEQQAVSFVRATTSVTMGNPAVDIVYPAGQMGPLITSGAHGIYTSITCRSPAYG